MNGFSPDCARVTWFSQCAGNNPPGCTNTGSAGQGCSVNGGCTDCFAGLLGVHRFSAPVVDPVSKVLHPDAFVIGSAWKANDCDRRYIVCTPGPELAALGVLKGDELVAVNGKPILSRLEIPLLHHRALGRIELEFVRSGKSFTVEYKD